MGLSFTLKEYGNMLIAVKSWYDRILRFSDFFSLPSAPDCFCLIRHDVDRKVRNALDMAILEQELGINSTYYFRVKPHTFKENIIERISQLGHEIGYHYECLSDEKGDPEAALMDFETNLSRLREITAVKSISMHGRPLSKFNNLDMWRSAENRALLRERFQILGEISLDIDYSDIVYINDTGRNWRANRANIRDKIDSGITADFQSGKRLLHYLNRQPHKKMVLQVHPERWSGDLYDWSCQWAKDRFINLCKFPVRLIRKN